jgi:hypothetical protein
MRLNHILPFGTSQPVIAIQLHIALREYGFSNDSKVKRAGLLGGALLNLHRSQGSEQTAKKGDGGDKLY